MNSCIFSHPLQMPSHPTGFYLEHVAETLQLFWLLALQELQDLLVGPGGAAEPGRQANGVVTRVFVRPGEGRERGARHSDGGREQTRRARGEDVVHHAHTSGALPEDGDPVRRPPEMLYVFLHPLQAQYLVTQALYKQFKTCCLEIWRRLESLNIEYFCYLAVPTWLPGHSSPR